MGNSKKIAALAVLPFTFAASAYAGQAGTDYVGIQYAMVTYKEVGFSSTYPSAVGAGFGHNVTDNFAIEVRLGTGMASDSIDILGTSVSLRVESMYGIYGVGSIPVGRDTSVYALLGYTEAKMIASGGGFSVSESESDISYGVGLDYSVGNNVFIGLEYTSYLSKPAGDASALGLRISFGL